MSCENCENTIARLDKTQAMLSDMAAKYQPLADLGKELKESEGYIKMVAGALPQAVKYYRQKYEGLLNALECIAAKDPNDVDASEAADMAVEFHGVARDAIKKDGPLR